MTGPFSPSTEWGCGSCPRKGIIPPISTLFSTIGIPSGAPPLLLGELWVTAQDAEEALFVPYPIGFPLSGTTHQNFNATYSVIEVSGDFAGQNITLHYQYLDTSFALDISLPWEEVLP